MKGFVPGFFAGKHVLITGASSGIGRAATVELAAMGNVSLTLVARGKDRLSAASADAKAASDKTSVKTSVLTIPCDCTDHAAVCTMVAAAEAEHGPVDVLLNFAGGAHGCRLVDLTPDIAESQMRGNYFSQLYPTQVVFKRMVEQGNAGRILLTSSAAGLLGVFGLSAYSPAKFALRGLAECIHYEGRPHGISVSILYPPDTQTAGYENEKTTMPPETTEINATAGLWEPDRVSARVLERVAAKQFRIMLGLESRMLGILTVGMAPGTSVAEVLLLPIMRAISGLFRRDFYKIIDKHHARKVNSESASAAAT